MSFKQIQTIFQNIAKYQKYKFYGKKISSEEDHANHNFFVYNRIALLYSLIISRLEESIEQDALDYRFQVANQTEVRRPKSKPKRLDLKFGV